MLRNWSANAVGQWEKDKKMQTLEHEQKKSFDDFLVAFSVG